MKVYKYRGIEDNILQRDLSTFKANQFFAPKFEMLNDPFEANFNEIISSTLDLLNSIFSVDANKLKTQLHEVIELKHKLGIFSLSKTCYSEQMWAYYASSNRGYCIEYDFEKLKDMTRNFDFSSELEMIYSDEIPILNIDDINGNSMFKKMYGVKKKNWAHEEEIRLIFDYSSLKSHHESAITSIYFGYQTGDYHIKTIKESFKNRDIKFYKINPNRLTNQLEAKFIFESIKKRSFDIQKYNFEILKYKNNSVVENYYIYLKGDFQSREIKEFALAFKEKYCYKSSNLNIFNTSEIVDLIGIYPLKGEDYIRYADAFIALADSTCEDFIFDYPYKDFYYKELVVEFKNK